MFGIAACAGLALALMTSLWLVLVGALAIIAAWTYTGGPRPYGNAGWGEVFVFIFFGVVATTGSEFVVSEKFTWAGVVASVAVGCIACSLLVINNLRDIPTDRLVGKRTLAVRLGDERIAALRDLGFEFYDWGASGSGEARFVVSWCQADSDVDALCHALCSN